MVDDEDYEEPRDRYPKVQYKLRVCDNPATQNMLHEEEFDNNNYKSIDETTVEPLSILITFCMTV